MKLSTSIASKLLALQNGLTLPESKLRHPVVTAMLDNGVLKKRIQGKTKVHIFLPEKTTLSNFLFNHCGISDLEAYIANADREDLTRGEAINLASNSKLKVIRTFKGFLLNSYSPITGTLNNKNVRISSLDGTFTFLNSFESFVPNAGFTIIGIENPENFRWIEKQKKLFKGLEPIFVSRYPQSSDLIRWLNSINNPYLHFGDFDFAGINIYWNEYKKVLKDRATFLVPEDIELRLAAHGNRALYDRQTLLVKKSEIREEPVLRLLSLMDQYKKGLEQEVYIV